MDGKCVGEKRRIVWRRRIRKTVKKNPRAPSTVLGFLSRQSRRLPAWLMRGVGSVALPAAAWLVVQLTLRVVHHHGSRIHNKKKNRSGRQPSNRSRVAVDDVTDGDVDRRQTSFNERPLIPKVEKNFRLSCDCHRCTHSTGRATKPSAEDSRSEAYLSHFHELMAGVHPCMDAGSWNFVKQREIRGERVFGG